MSSYFQELYLNILVPGLDSQEYQDGADYFFLFFTKSVNGISLL